MGLKYNQWTNILLLSLAFVVVLIVSQFQFARVQRSDLPVLSNQIPFCMIHLKTRVDRENNMNRSLRLAGSCGFIPINDNIAVTGTAEMNVNAFMDMTNHPNVMRTVLRRGEVGCFTSHRVCWQMGYKNGTLVCEDDAVVNTNCLHRMHGAIEYISKTLKLTKFVIHGRYSQPRSFVEICHNEPITEGIVKVNCPCYNTNLYFMSAAACQTLDTAAEDLKLWMPSDDFISSLSGCHPTSRIEASEGIRAFAIIPAGLSVMKSRSDTQ